MDAFTRLEGIAAPLRMANVDTDKIVPSRFLKTVTRSGLDEALFADLRKDEAFILNQPGYENARILIALDNFGCGSSREHAPWALTAFGIRCIIAPSFAEIFQGNCRNNGILTVVLTRDTVESLMALASDPAKARMVVDLNTQGVTTSQGEVERFDIAPSHKHFLLNGLNEIDQTLEMASDIETFEKDRREIQPWLSEPLRV